MGLGPQTALQTTIGLKFTLIKEKQIISSCESQSLQNDLERDSDTDSEIVWTTDWIPVSPVYCYTTAQSFSVTQRAVVLQELTSSSLTSPDQIQ